MESSLEQVADMECKTQCYLDDIQKLADTNHELQEEINELNEAIDDLALENDALAVDAREARKSFTGLQIAVSVLIFAYGMFYGAYFGKCV